MSMGVGGVIWSIIFCFTVIVVAFLFGVYYGYIKAKKENEERLDKLERAYADDNLEMLAVMRSLAVLLEIRKEVPQDA